MSPAEDAFGRLLEQVRQLLHAESRVSYRRLKRQFALSDDDLEALKDELIHAQRVATDENGRVLVRSQAPPARSAAPGYTPDHLARKILSIRSSLQGEKKQVTVLFCDVANSMTLAEHLGPEAWHDVLDQLFRCLNTEIHAVEGTINQYTGDGVMALFGAPIAAENHALRACIAALNVQRQAQPLCARVQAAHGMPLALRIGLNSGEVIVGAIGDDLRMDYTAQGHVVGIAARLESMAGPGEVLASDLTARAVGTLCELAPLGPREIKGVGRKVEVFRLVSVREDANRFDASRDRGLTPFVGRRHLMNLLRAGLAAAAKGEGRSIHLVGDAGVGKSRLCHEIQITAGEEGFAVWEGHAVPFGKQRPYLPIQQIVRSQLGLAGNDSPARVREALRSWLAAMGLDETDADALLCDFLGVSDAARPPLQIDPEARQRRVFGVLRQVLDHALREAGRALMVVEDLHWLDEGSEQLLTFLRSEGPLAGLLLLTSSRPEGEAAWLSGEGHSTITVEPLDGESTRVLVTQLAGAQRVAPDLVDAIHQRTGGNPFFCEEIVLSLRETGRLQADRAGGASLTPDAVLEIPASVKTVLAARIDRLPDDAKAVLQAAAVIGRHFEASLLGRVAEVAEPALARAMATLIASRFVDERYSRGGSDYQFKHALTQEVALGSLLTERRRNLHAAAAEGVEEVHADAIGEFAGVAAFHWEQAARLEPAARAYAQAARHVSQRNRRQEMQYLRKVLELTETLEKSPATGELRLQSLAGLIASGAWRFSMSGDEVRTLTDEAIALAQGAGLKDLAALLHSGYGASLGMMRGEIRSWGESIDAIIERSEGDVSAEIYAALLGNHCYSLYPRGGFELGLRQAGRAIEMSAGRVEYGQASGYSVLVLCLNLSVLHAASRGSLDEAMELSQRGLDLAEKHSLGEEQIWLRANRSEMVVLTGHPAGHPMVQDAVANAARAMAMAEETGSDFTRGVAMRAQAITRAMSGDYQAAAAAALACLEHCRARHAHLEVEARCLSLLALAQLGAGDLGAARRSAEAAIARSRDQGAPFFEAMAHLSLARILQAAEGRTAEARIRASLDRASALVEQTGGRSLGPQITEQRARLQHVLGDDAAARTLLGEARDGHRACHADGHAERLAAELGSAAGR